MTRPGRFVRILQCLLVAYGLFVGAQVAALAWSDHVAASIGGKP